MALIGFFAGLVMVAAAALAFLTPAYRTLTALYAKREGEPEPAPAS